jgi:hypothetical protein
MVHPSTHPVHALWTKTTVEVGWLDHGKHLVSTCGSPKFANDELGALVDALYTDINFEVSPADLLGALVTAGRRLPPAVVRELVGLYIERERAEVAKLAETEGEGDQPQLAS